MKKTTIFFFTWKNLEIQFFDLEKPGNPAFTQNKNLEMAIFEPGKPWKNLEMGSRWTVVTLNVIHYAVIMQFFK